MTPQQQQDDGFFGEGFTTTFYTEADCHYCHRVRLVLVDKRIPCSVEEIESSELPADVLQANPKGMLPCLKDRSAILFFPNVIMEYLEDRYPHPPHMPVMPLERAHRRTQILQFDQDISTSVDKLTNPGYSRSSVLRQHRQHLRDQFLALAPGFEQGPYFLSTIATIADFVLLPIMWRLPSLGVVLENTRQTRAMLEYQERLFETKMFQDSLTPREIALRPKS